MGEMINGDDNNKNNTTNGSKKPAALLQGDGFYLDRLLQRDSSVGTSSRIYYRANSEGVPFQWERQPGTPKHPLAKEVIAPLTPPPSVQSLGLPPRPKCADQSKQSNSKWKAWFWKRNKKKKDGNESKRNNNHMSYEHDHVISDRFEREFMGGSMRDLSSSASSSSSSSNRGSSGRVVSMQSEFESREESMDGAFVCSPWNITALFVRVAKRLLWEATFFAVLSSLWGLRNSVIFRSGVVEEETLSDKVKTKVALWVKSKKSLQGISVESIKNNPDGVRSLRG